VLVNAAREPEVPDLADALNRAGAKIEGAGKHSIHIEGVRELRPLNHVTMPDRIEAGTFLVAGLMTGGDVTVTHCVPVHLRALLDKLQQAGAEIETGDTHVRIRRVNGVKSVDVITAPYPGFATDLQAQFMAAMAVADGISILTETIYPDRFTHVAELRRLGAKIRLDGNIAVVTGAHPGGVHGPGQHRDLARLPHRSRLRAHRREVRGARCPDRAAQERGLEPHVIVFNSDPQGLPRSPRRDGVEQIGTAHRSYRCSSDIARRSRSAGARSTLAGRHDVARVVESVGAGAAHLRAGRLRGRDENRPGSR
jgi:hypothetical protein